MLGLRRPRIEPELGRCRAAPHIAPAALPPRLALGCGQVVMGFDYESEPELFPSRFRSSRRQPVGYKRFIRAAEAIRFAIEELPPASLAAAWLDVDEDRFDAQAVRRLYEHADYAPRRARAASRPAAF